MTFPANIIVAEFDDLLYPIFLRMLQDGLGAFRLRCPCFDFKWYTFAFHSHKKIQFKTGILLEVVKVLTFLVKRVSHEVFEDGAFEAAKIALKDVCPCSWSEHRNQKSYIRRVYLEDIVLCVPFHWKTGDVGIIAATDNTSIF